MITHVASLGMPISLWSLIRPFCKRLVFEPARDPRGHEALSNLLDQGGGLAREWDNRERILPSWEEGLGKESGNAQDKAPVFHFILGLALLYRRRSVVWGTPRTCLWWRASSSQGMTTRGSNSVLYGGLFAHCCEVFQEGLGCRSGHGLRWETQKTWKLHCLVTYLYSSYFSRFSI